MQSADANKPFIDATNEMSDGRGLAEIHEGADHGFAVPGGALPRGRCRSLLREGTGDLRRRQSPDAGRHGAGHQDAG